MRKKPRCFRHVRVQTADGEEGWAMQLKWTIHYFLHRKLIRQLVSKHAARYALSGMIFLKAHGTSCASEYCYFDMAKKKRVQDWINEHDGKTALLIVGACNHLNLSITSNRSIVIHPNRKWSLQELMRAQGGGFIRVYVPSVGYVERKYRLLKRLITRK